jgi:molecular chaperone GrpE
MSDPEAPGLGSEQPEAARADALETTAAAVADSEAPAAAPPAGEDEITALRKERDSLVDQLLRRRADFENYKRRVERDRQNLSVEVAAEVIKDLLPTLDNLERALAASGDEAPLRDGVLLIQRELRTALEARGLVVEDPSGAPFDPARHQALAHEVVPGAVPGTVVETFRRAYLFGERLLRPALVRVAKEPEAAEDAKADTEAPQ